MSEQAAPSARTWHGGRQIPQMFDSSPAHATAAYSSCARPAPTQASAGLCSRSVIQTASSGCLVEARARPTHAPTRDSWPTATRSGGATAKAGGTSTAPRRDRRIVAAHVRGWQVDCVVDLDEPSNTLWFTAVGKEPGCHPYYRQLYSTVLDGTTPPESPRLLTARDAGSG